MRFWRRCRRDLGPLVVRVFAVDEDLFFAVAHFEFEALQHVFLGDVVVVGRRDGRCSARTVFVRSHDDGHGACRFWWRCVA